MKIKNIHNETIEVSASDPKMGREFLGGKYVDEKTRKSIRYFSPKTGGQRIVETIDVERLGALIYAVSTSDIRGLEVELAKFPKEINGRINLMDLYDSWRANTKIEEVN
jgi:hypothetical protein